MTAADITKHYEYITNAWEMLSDKKKHFIRPYGAYDRLKIKRIGVPSGNAAVYEIDFADEWVVKVNVLESPAQQVFAENNDFVNATLTPYVKELDELNKPEISYAKIACFDHKVYISREVAVTFEPKMRGKTLQEMILNGNLRVDELKAILDKIKNTLRYLYFTADQRGVPLKFNHNDLHSGNVFIETVGTKHIPILFDFDWSSFDWFNKNIIKPEYSHTGYDVLVSKLLPYAVGTINAKLTPLPPHPSPPPPIKKNTGKESEKLTCKLPPHDIYRRVWYEVNGIYSLFMNYNKANKADFLKRTDMTMLLNHTLWMVCINDQTPNTFFEYIMNMQDIDKKIDIGEAAATFD